MDFTLVNEPEMTVSGRLLPSRRSVLAHGAIQAGDSRGLLKALSEADRDQYGNITLYLDSDGGNVEEAMKMVDVMDFFETTAIVKNGDVCASACASILFISSRIHLIEEGGRIGLHPCTIEKTTNDFCNDIIAQNAVYHGTAHAILRTSMSDGILQQLRSESHGASSENMLYFGRTVAIQVGLYGPPIHDPTLAFPTFSCTPAMTLLVKLVCSDRRLARYEASSTHYYGLVKRFRSDLPMWRAVQSEKRQHDRKLAQCKSNTTCLLVEYARWRAFLRYVFVDKTINGLLDAATDVARDRYDPARMARALLLYCVNSDECGRPFLLDATYEMMNANIARHLVEFVLTGALDASSNCLLQDLCRTDINGATVLVPSPDQLDLKGSNGSR